MAGDTVQFTAETVPVDAVVEWSASIRFGSGTFGWGEWFEARQPYDLTLTQNGLLTVNRVDNTRQQLMVHATISVDGVEYVTSTPIITMNRP